jgi:hypothetical protein
MSAVGMPQDRLHTHALGPPGEMARLASEFDVGVALEPGASTNNLLLASNKMFTYFLAGNAVIATDTPGHRSIAERAPGACFLYRPGDIATLAGQLAAWNRDRASLVQARWNSWMAAETDLNWEWEKGRFLELVRGLWISTEASMPAVAAGTPQQ